MIWSHSLMSIAAITLAFISAIANDIRWYRQLYGPFLLLMLSIITAGASGVLFHISLHADHRWMALHALVGIAWGVTSGIVFVTRIVRQEWRR